MMCVPPAVSHNLSSQVTGTYARLHAGHYDHELTTLSKATLGNPVVDDLAARLKADAPCMQKLFMNMENCQESIVLAPAAKQDNPQDAEAPPEEETRASEEVAAEKIAASVTMTPAQKLKLVEQLNASSKAERDKALDDAVLAAAGEIWSVRVRTANSLEAVTRMMNQDPSGPTARLIFVDWTMLNENQTGPKSRRVGKDPTRTLQRNVATGVKAIPVSPVHGTVVVRSAQAMCDTFLSQLRGAFPFRRSAYVPIELPKKLGRPRWVARCSLHTEFADADRCEAADVLRWAGTRRAGRRVRWARSTTACTASSSFTERWAR